MKDALEKRLSCGVQVPEEVGEVWYAMDPVTGRCMCHRCLYWGVTSSQGSCKHARYYRLVEQVVTGSVSEDVLEQFCIEKVQRFVRDRYRPEPNKIVEFWKVCCEDTQLLTSNCLIAVLRKYGSEPPTGKSSGVSAATAQEVALEKARFCEGIVDARLTQSFVHTMESVDLGNIIFDRKLLNDGSCGLLVLSGDTGNQFLQADDMITAITIVSSDLSLDLSTIAFSRSCGVGGTVHFPDIFAGGNKLNVTGLRFKFDTAIVRENVGRNAVRQPKHNTGKSAKADYRGSKEGSGVQQGGAPKCKKTKFYSEKQSSSFDEAATIAKLLDKQYLEQLASESRRIITDPTTVYLP
jgi:hypothetical protein